MNRLGGTLTLALGVARRQTVRTFKAPYLLAPMLVFPLLLFAAFAGGLSAISRTPNFNYFNFTTFQLIYVLMVGAALGGVQTGLTVADDFESGFARRMLISTPQRGGLVLGYVLAGLVRFAIVALVLTAVAVASGARMHGDVIQVAGLYGVAGLFNVASTLYATGFAFRARSTSVGPAIQTPIMLPLFLAPVFAPRALLSGWLRHVADVNPVTPLLESGRGLAAGAPVSVAIAYSLLFVLVVLSAAFALAGLHSAEQGGERVSRRERRRARRAPAAT